MRATTPPAGRDRLPKVRGGEQATVNAILAFLRAHRIPAFRMNTGATKIGGRFIRFGVAGMADILGVAPCLPDQPGRDRMWEACDHRDGHCVKGKLLAVEVKSATGTVSPAQQAFLDQVNGAGGRGFVARDVATVAKELGL